MTGSSHPGIATLVDRRWRPGRPTRRKSSRTLVTQGTWKVDRSAVIVSVSVAVVFGDYACWKVSRLDPIEALRCE
jgi:hypothetical protein